MKKITLKHLLGVLWLWLLLVEVLGEDGVTSKSEKRLVIKQESGPKGDSLVRSFVSTKVSRTFTSTSSFDEEKITDKPPDERQSTIRLSNDSVDLSKNTVPVLKYPVPTESTLKEKYWRTTEGPDTTPSKKGPKLKWNMTRTRPSDLTTLLVYNALTPGRYPSTTQVAESMPPTAWALASLKGPASSEVKPFVNWSTRLSRTPSLPTTEVTGQVADVKTTIEPDPTGFDITAPGSEEVETTVFRKDTTSPTANIEVTTLPVTTETLVEATTLKPEENTISVPPLASLKNNSDYKENNDFLSVPVPELRKNVTPRPTIVTNYSSVDNSQQNSVEAEETKKSTTSMPLITLAITRLNESTTSEELFKETSGNSELAFEITEDSAKKSLQEVDPSINTINEKKEEPISTSTVISLVNSTVTIHVTPTSAGVAENANSSDFNDVNHTMKSDDEFTKTLPLTLETTTLSNSVFQSSLPTKTGKFDSAINEANHTTNDINVTETNEKIILVPSSGNASSEIPSTIRSNEIKPEPISKNKIKTVNITDFKMESYPNYVPELFETTQSNDIQVQDQIKPVNKTLIPQLGSENSSVVSKLPENEILISSSKPISPTTLIPLNNTTFLPLTTITEDNPSIYTIINNPVESINETLLTLPPVTPTEYITTPENNLTTMNINYNSTSILNSSSIVVPTTFVNTTDEAPTFSTSENITTSTNLSKTDDMITTSPSPTTKSNEIKEQELVTEIHQFPSEGNATNFDTDSKNSIKNGTFVFHDGDDGDDDDTLSYNQTEIERKVPHDTINNNENEDDDDLLETAVNGSISITVRNPINKTTSVPVTRFSSIKTTTVSDEVTIIDDDHTSIEDDTIYDTGVIMTVYVRLVIRATYNDLCKNKDQLKDSIVKVFKNYAERTINRRQVKITNLENNDCSELRDEMESRLIPVHIMLTNNQGQYDKSLNDLFISLARQKNLDFKYPISQVEKVQQETLLETESQISGTMVAVIVISSIAAVCLFALTVLLVIMRKRQSGFNYGQRCTPVSLDDYSLDNISVYNSVRRKAIRASKRSYGNPAFDDPDAVSNPVNFAGLSNMASDKSKTDEEFSSLPQVVVKPDELPPGAETKNRYANVIPIPETRVQLRSSSPEDQFINANYVKGAKGADKFYIACQAPIQNTIEDFWKMIWDEQSRLIIMLTALTENGVEKCADYLPPSEVLDCHRIFGDLQVTLKKREAREKYVISSLQLKNLETNLWREVTHMWYAGWPPTGVPPEPSSVIAFLIEARSYSKSSPIVVHCSPGTGRTGTVIAIDIAIRDFEAGRSVDIPKTVVQVRRGRAGAVQTKDQYSFIYKVIHLYATKLTGGGLDSI